MGGDRFPFDDTSDQHRESRGRRRRGEHGDGLPPHLQPARGPHGSLRLPPHRGRGARPASRSSATPRRRGSSSTGSAVRSRSSGRRGQRPGDDGPDHAPGRAGREGPAASRSARRVHDLDCDTVIVALGTKANPIVTETTPGPPASTGGATSSHDSPVMQATNLPGVFAGGTSSPAGPRSSSPSARAATPRRAIAAYLHGGKKWPLTQEAVASFQAPCRGRRPPCPKCHRPVDGDEGYVCCAGAELPLALRRLRQGQRGLRLPLGDAPRLRRQAPRR